MSVIGARGHIHGPVDRVEIEFEIGLDWDEKIEMMLKTSKPEMRDIWIELENTWTWARDSWIELKLKWDWNWNENPELTFWKNKIRLEVNTPKNT